MHLPQDNRVGTCGAFWCMPEPSTPKVRAWSPCSPWLKSFLAGLSPKTAQLLRPYASWSVLPRTRHRAARLWDHGERPAVRERADRDCRTLLDLA